MAMKNKKSHERNWSSSKTTVYCTSLLTIYKSFIRPHLDNGDVVFDQPSNDAFLTNSKLFSTMQL